MTRRGAEKMKHEIIGVECSKDHLDAHRLADGATRRFANDQGSNKALIKWLAETPLNRVVFEPVSSWNKDPATGMSFIQSGPRRVRSHTGLQDSCGPRLECWFWETIAKIRRRTFPLVSRSRPQAALIAQGCAEGHSLERHRVPLRTFAPTASPDWALATAAWRRTRASIEDFSPTVCP
jgi:hypothetical protein